MSRLALALALMALAVLAPAAAGDTLIADSPCPAGPNLASGCSDVSAHGGRLVWSAYDATAGGFVLMTAARAAGVPARIAVPARALPFDADLGEDARGRVVATYSRCQGDPSGPPSGCTVRQLALAAGATERALLPGISSTAPLHPSRWGDRVAVVRRRGTATATAALCTASGTPRCRTLPGGPAGVRPQAAGPTALDLDADRVAMTWFWYRNDDIRRHAILVERLGARRATTVVTVGAGLAGNAAVHAPVLDGGYVYFARGGASCDYRSTPNTVGRYDLARRRIEEVPSPPLSGLAVDASAVVYAACGTFPDLPGAVGSTRILRADPPPFDRPGAPDPDRAAPCPTRRPASGWTTQTLARPGFPPFALALLGRPSGAATALWPARGALEYASRSAGAAFGTPRRLRTPAEPLGTPWAAAGDRGHVVAAWRAGRGRGAAVEATAGTVGGRLAAPQSLDLDPAHPDLLGVPVVAISPGGQAVVVWTEPPPSGPNLPSGRLLASFRPPGASAFGAPVEVATGPSLVRALAVAIDDAGHTLVLVVGLGGNQPFAVVEGSASGMAVAQNLGTPRGAPIQAAAALERDGAATLAWVAGRAIQVATRAAGAAFAPPVTVSTDGVPTGRTLSLASRAGRIALAWSEADVRGTVGRLMVADGTVGAPLDGTRALRLRRGRIQELALVLGARGAAAVAWRLTCARDGGRVMAATRPAGSTRFGADTVVSGRDRAVRTAPTVILGRRPTVAWVGAAVRAATPAR